MDLEYIASHNVSERYLNGQLTSDELDEYEERLLWCVETQQDLAYTQQLKTGLKAIHAESRIPVESPPQGGASNPLGWFVGWLRNPLPAAAAAAAFVMLSTVTISSVIAPSEKASELVSGAIVFDSFRSDADNPLAIVENAREVRRSSLGPTVTLVVFPTHRAREVLRATLERNQHGAIQSVDDYQGGWVTIWQAAVETGDQEAFSVVLRSELLRPGVHRLRLETVENTQSSPQARGTTVFRVTDA